MKFEILEEVPRVAGSRFRNKTLTTEITWDGLSPLPPTCFDTFRVSYRTEIYRGPEGRKRSYQGLLDYHKAEGIEFPGTWHFGEAVDIEYWEQGGDDGHIEWGFEAVYRMFLDPEIDADTGELESRWKWLHDTPGDTIMHILHHAVYELNKERRSAE